MTESTDSKQITGFNLIQQQIESFGKWSFMEGSHVHVRCPSQLGQTIRISDSVRFQSMMKNDDASSDECVKCSILLGTDILKRTKQWHSLFIKTVNSCCLLLLLPISCYFLMPAPTYKCEKGACGFHTSPPTSPTMVCIVHLTSLLPCLGCYIGLALCLIKLQWP